MIESVEVKNFKCFQRDRHFDLGCVTLLAGVNGIGKKLLNSGAPASTVVVPGLERAATER